MCETTLVRNNRNLLILVKKENRQISEYRENLLVTLTSPFSFLSLQLGISPFFLFDGIHNTYTEFSI